MTTLLQRMEFDQVLKYIYMGIGILFGALSSYAVLDYLINGLRLHC
jgi:hypothetical protein